MNLKSFDREIYDLIEKERARQTQEIQLIASENIVSRAVLEATGSILTNKYAEGYPHKRYYGGCKYVDDIEDLAIERAKELFGCDYANVQPHSGSQANSAAYMAFIKPGDRVLGMDLSHGGHLTHGSPVNFSGILYDFHAYGVNEEGLIDYEALEKKAKEIMPKMIVAGASAYARTLDFERFSYIAKRVGAYLLVDMAHIAGLIATGVHPSPVGHADVITSTTHKTLRGPRGGLILAKKDFAKVINKSVFPGSQGGPLEHVIAAKAVCFKEAMGEDFKAYTQQVVNNAQALAKALMDLDYHVVSGGTDNHLMLVDLRNKGLTGKVAEALLGEVKITVNKNTVPQETESPFVTSGIRLGTANVTTRGMKEEDMRTIAHFIDQALVGKKDKEQLIQEVLAFVKPFKY